jgi:hypothetical protein
MLHYNPVVKQELLRGRMLVSGIIEVWVKPDMLIRQI